MRNRAPLVVLAVMLAAVIPSCGGSDDAGLQPTAGSGGQDAGKDSSAGGTGTKGGTAGSAGTAATGGVGGTAGTGGVGGKAGTGGAGAMGGNAGVGGASGAGAGGTAGVSGTAGTAGDAGTSGAGGTAGIDAGDAMPADGPMDVATEPAPEACANIVVENVGLKPLDVYMMVDRSGSMDGQPWTNLSAALNQVFNDPELSGTTMALSFFPLDDTCTAPPSCLGDSFLTPAVDWGLLPGQAPALSAAVAAATPIGCTPTQEALNGALRAAQARQTLNPNRNVAVVIVSDGEPCCGECPVETAAGLGQIAANFFNGTPPIETFAVFVAPAASATMTAIAQSGGTTQAYDASTGSQAFVDALKQINQLGVPCSFAMPTLDSGTIDPSKVTLLYYAGGGPTATTMPPVMVCGAGDGWYFDNPANPTKMILCPTTCNTIKADTAAKVSISFGCVN